MIDLINLGRVIVVKNELLENKPFLLITGNGFDLFHGVKSKYIDFIESDQGCNPSLHFKYFVKIKRDLKWIDIEKELSYLQEYIEKYFNDAISTSGHEEYNFALNTSEENVITFETINGNSKMELVHCIFKKIGIENESEYFFTIDQKEEFFKAYFEDYKRFTQELMEYLEKAVTNPKNTYNSDLKLYLKDIKYIFNYNYTSLAKEYYGNFIAREFSLHGRLSESIVLGVPYSDSKSSFKKISKEVQVTSQNRTIFSSDWTSIENPSYSENEDCLNKTIAIMGHSLGKTDWHTLKKFFINDGGYLEGKVETITVFYHDLSAKEALIENIIQMLGLERALKSFEDKKIIFANYTDIKI